MAQPTTIRLIRCHAAGPRMTGRNVAVLDPRSAISLTDEWLAAWRKIRREAETAHRAFPQIPAICAISHSRYKPLSQ